MTAVEDRLKSLMLRGLDGDAAAQRDLLSELAGLLRRYYGRRLGDGAADLEDLVQETLIAVHTRRASYDRAQPFTAWAYAVARYKLIDHYRRRRVRASAPLEDADALFAPDESEAATASRDVERLLSALPPKQREAIRLTRLQGLSVAEAAEVSGQSESAVKVGVHRGLKTLMARLRGRDDL
ncbi:MAG: sigma-70 family RNA polymerase sigma factor [Phenylobacterium sp.]|uniref:sigma-70 family RNA polymerase sigma factor n=1 Tax=Phenylobacterium sp. TaxID=1871053 RepID=UPI00391B517F